MVGAQKMANNLVFLKKKLMMNVCFSSSVCSCFVPPLHTGVFFWTVASWAKLFGTLDEGSEILVSLAQIHLCDYFLILL